MFFELRTPRDMLAKAERELARLQRGFTIDNVFNFFVTAHHIMDYVKAAGTVPGPKRRAFLADPDIQACQALCNKGKHVHLRDYPEALTDIADGTFGGAAFGELAFGEGEVWTLFYGNHAIDVHSLPSRVVEKWRRFLDEHGL